MTDSTQTPKTGSNKPTHVAYQVREKSKGESFWTRIGSAWAHADGNGFNIQIDAVPLDGRITLRIPSEKPD